ncbi:MAG: hypothetical protein DME06_18565, partial [Candidatus Rokuibacteriota bacterium]
MEDGARAYHRWRLILTGARLGLTALVLALGVWAAAGPARPPVPAHWPGLALVVLIELAILGFAVQLATGPLTVIASYVLPRRFGLLHQPWRHWLVDRAKGLAISGLLALVAFEVLYALLRSTPRWWVAAAAIFFAGSVLQTAVAPVWLFPLFYR